MSLFVLSIHLIYFFHIITFFRIFLSYYLSCILLFLRSIVFLQNIILSSREIKWPSFELSPINNWKSWENINFVIKKRRKGIYIYDHRTIITLLRCERRLYKPQISTCILKKKSSIVWSKNVYPIVFVSKTCES